MLSRSSFAEQGSARWISPWGRYTLAMAKGQRSPDSSGVDRGAPGKVAVGSSPEFQRWLATIGQFDMDGETFYLLLGDVPMSLDEVASYWVGEHEAQDARRVE